MPRDILGIRFACNVAIATSLIWYALAYLADTNPLWAIASMVAAADPQVDEATERVNDFAERVNDFAPLEVMSLVSNRAAARA